jgi:ABC-type sugar transport system ATPase subunit
MRAVVGFDSYDSGDILLDGKPMKIKTPKEARDNHISMAPEDRKALGLVLCRNIKENISLQNYDQFSFGGFLSLGDERRKCAESARNMAVKMNDLSDIVENLSGGNQQKVVLGKCLMSKPQVIILDEPTRGIDIGSKASIYNMMVELTKQGVAIIMISSEMPELIGMSDRIIVMANGTIRGECTQKNENTQQEILRLAL